MLRSSHLLAVCGGCAVTFPGKRYHTRQRHRVVEGLRLCLQTTLCISVEAGHVWRVPSMRVFDLRYAVSEVIGRRQQGRQVGWLRITMASNTLPNVLSRAIGLYDLGCA
jgi:hypothetical protein